MNKPLKRSQRKKRAWFALGVTALQRALPGVPHVYACPLCVQRFSSLDALSFEDVPPKSIGGKPLVLTCRQCNSVSGHALDAYVKADRDLQKILSGDKETRVRLTRDGQTITASARFAPGKLEFHGLPKHSNPRSHSRFLEHMERCAKSGSDDWGFEVQFAIRSDPQKAAIAWLRIGYLYAFAALGYHFILRPELERVREQIRTPMKNLLPNLVKVVPKPLGPDGIAFVDSPCSLTSILVQMGGVLVFLPGLRQASDFFERIAAFPVGRVTLAGSHLPLPRRPMFALDMPQPS